MEHEYGEYVKIVETVKAEFAKRGRSYAGDEVTHEIAKRWAKAQKRPHKEPAPQTPADVPKSTNAPTAPGFNEPAMGAVRERKPGTSLGIKLPQEPEGQGWKLTADG